MRRFFVRCFVSLVLSLPALGAAPRVDRHGDPLPDGALARLGTIRQRVAASQIAVSADGSTLITVAGGRTIARWDAVTGRMRGHRLLPGKPTSQFWLSPDGRLLAVAEKKSVAVFDTETGACKCRLAVSALRAAFRPDGKAIATAEYDKPPCRVRLWDLASGKDCLLAEAPSYVNAFAFRPDGKRLFAAVDNHSLRCWDVESGKQVWRNEHWASHLTVSWDGQTVCSDTYLGQGLIQLWEADTGRRIGGGSPEEKSWTGPLAFAPDGRTVFQTNFKKDVLLWDVATGKIRRRFAKAGSPFALAPDGKTFVSISGARLQRWDVENGKALYPDTAERGHTAAVCGVAFTPDGRNIVTTGADETIRVWDLSTQRPRTLLTGVRPRYGAIITWAPDSWRPLPFPRQTLAVTADSRQLLSDDCRQLRLSDIRTGEEVRRFDVRTVDNKANVGTARLSTDGHTLWALTYQGPQLTSDIRFEQKETLIGWDVATGRRLSTHTVICGNLEENVLAPDGRSVALAIGSIRDVASGRNRPQKADWFLSYPCAFSADSRLLAGVVGGREQWNGIAVHELLTGRPLMRVEASVGWSSRFAFSPDGRLLIASGRDALHVWEVSSGRRLLHLPAEERLPIQAPGTFALCLAVAPDGRSAATGHEDGTVLLWDLAPAWRRLTERSAARAAAEIDVCWADLLKDNPRTAYAAMDRLATAPPKALSLLRKHLHPVTIDARWLEERLAALDSDEFAVREKATRDLTAIAEAVEPRLRRAMTKDASLEMRRRLQAILEAPRSLVPPAETVRRLRAVAVMERIATEEARALLRELAKGEAGDRLTRAAVTALARLAARPCQPRRTPTR
ncbi:MAG TPA: PQQ-binding-like beta-propeller repeat protein [Gemmataceae bacterium]|jgi:WD40 repeat protein